MGGHIARMKQGRSAFKFLTATPRKESFRISRRTWEENIRMNLKEVDINTRNWVDSAQDRDYWKALGVP